MARINPIMYNGQEIVPIQFLKAVLPNPGDLGKNYTGETSIGCRIRGLKDGKEHTYYVYNNCSHHAAFKETGAQGSKLYNRCSGHDRCKDVYDGHLETTGCMEHVEEFDPDPFMKELNEQGLPWHELFNIDLEL
jgi:saccharopine dehydrogenase (NAD+, L-lysine-forming)